MLQSGFSYGLVVEIGEGVSQLFTMFDGYTIESANIRLDFAGQHLTDYMVSLLNQKGYSILPQFREYVSSFQRVKTFHL